MLNSKIKTSYIQALLDISLEEKIIDKFYKNTKLIIEIAQNNPKFLELLSSYNVDNDIKHEVVKEALSKNCHPLFINFINLLIDKNQVNHLLLICKSFIIDVDFTNGRHHGIVYSTFSLDAEKLKEIEKIISIKLSQNISLDNLIDKQLLGGIRVEVGDFVIDQSVKAHFDKIRNLNL